jgi:hypothetical protein
VKRSEINAIMRDADSFARSNRFYLPPFAYWTPEDWQKRGEEAREISDIDMGWASPTGGQEIFGTGDFSCSQYATART